eukprot:3868183-Prymnesium_polylepis.1
MASTVRRFSPVPGQRSNRAPVGSEVSVAMGVVLTVLSIMATYLTIQQGTWKVDAQECALVGS